MSDPENILAFPLRGPHERGGIAVPVHPPAVPIALDRGVSLLEEIIRREGPHRVEWTAYDDEQDARDHEEMAAWYSHVDALLVNGVDANYERRAYMRSLVTQRQQAEAAGEKARGEEHEWAGARADELARIAALRLHNKEMGGDKRREGRHGKGVKGGARQRDRRRRRVLGGVGDAGGERPQA